MRDLLRQFRSSTRGLLGASDHAQPTPDLRVADATTVVGQSGTGANPDAIDLPARQPKALQITVIAELSIPACKLYRVDAKVDALQHLGHQVEVVEWSNQQACHQALQLCDVLVFYRVGRHPHVAALLDNARRLGIPTLFETDDLVVDPEVYGTDPNVLRRPDWEQRNLLEGVALYRDMLLACDYAIVSTEPLAAAVRGARSPTGGATFVVENAPSPHMLRLADRILLRPLPRSDGRLVIGYGSGTRTHDADFAVIVPALMQVLDRCPNAELALHGHLSMPDDLRRFGKRVRQFPPLGFDDYLQVVATWDVNLVPLQRSAFTEAKSNIKFLEAALVQVPSICTPTEPFRSVVEPGVTGLLADTTADWVSALSFLLDSAERRREIGARARATILERYHPERIARDQIRPILEQLPQPKRRARLLVVNDAPPAENDAHPIARLHACADFDVRTFCIEDHDFARYPGAAPRLERRLAAGRDIVSIRPSERPARFQYWNPEVAEAFGKLAAAWQPDVVVVGHIARLGVSLISECLTRGTPYVVVLKDDWWFSDPALEAARDERASGTSADDLRDAASRSANPELVYHRYFELRDLLLHAKALVVSDRHVRDTCLRHNLPEDLLWDGDIHRVVPDILAGRGP